MIRRRLLLLAAVISGVFVAAGGSSIAKPTDRNPKPVAPAVKPAAQHFDPAMVASGRSLFVARCAKCHALPNVASRSAEQWPRTIEKMAKRSGLRTAEQKQAVLAYVLSKRGK